MAPGRLSTCALALVILTGVGAGGLCPAQAGRLKI